jgi:hypothetical protein
VKTAYELAIEKLEAAEPIPRITDPQGTSWRQPDRSEILIDETHALMTAATFKELAEYSASKPTGVYPGKMWKRHDGAFDFEFMTRGGVPEWLLCWYGESQIGPGFCSNHHRKIILVDGELPGLNEDVTVP